MIPFYEIVKLIRINHNFSQDDLAKKLDVNKSYISLIEANKKDPGLQFIRNFSNEFKIPVSFLLWEGFHDDPISKNDKKMKDTLSNLMKSLQGYYFDKLIQKQNAAK